MVCALALALACLGASPCSQCRVATGLFRVFIAGSAFECSLAVIQYNYNCLEIRFWCWTIVFKSNCWDRGIQKDSICSSYEG